MQQRISWEFHIGANFWLIALDAKARYQPMRLELPAFLSEQGSSREKNMSEKTALLFEKFKALSIEVTTYEHPPLHTVEESQALRGSIAGAHTKNLFLRDRKGAHFLVTALEDAEIDLKSIHHIIGASGRVSFGKPDAMEAYLGVRPGAVTPLGVLNDEGGQVKVVLDEDLMRHDIINAHPLHNEATTSITRADLIRFLEAVNHTPAILKVSR